MTQPDDTRMVSVPRERLDRWFDICEMNGLENIANEMGAALAASPPLAEGGRGDMGNPITEQKQRVVDVFLDQRREFALSNHMVVSLERGSDGMPEVTLWNEAGDPIAEAIYRETENDRRVPVSLQGN
jgi:hypothetical protein